MSQRTLWLLRHAKAAGAPPPGGSDHDRRLAPRGRRDAVALGHKLGALCEPGMSAPGLVLCSSAARTTETAELVASGQSASAAVDRRRRLYYGSPGDLLEELRTLDDAVHSVMLVGHNPAIASLAVAMLADDDVEGRGRLEERGFPTCALAVLTVQAAGWAALAAGTARLEGYFTPPY